MKPGTLALLVALVLFVACAEELPVASDDRDLRGGGLAYVRLGAQLDPNRGGTMRLHLTNEDSNRDACFWVETIPSPNRGNGVGVLTSEGTFREGAGPDYPVGSDIYRLPRRARTRVVVNLRQLYETPVAAGDCVFVDVAYFVCEPTPTWGSVIPYERRGRLWATWRVRPDFEIESESSADGACRRRQREVLSGVQPTE